MQVKLQSTNPDFSYLIRKNPNNHIMLRRIRKGVAAGWFDVHDASNYFLHFTETGNEVSYRQTQHDDFDYLNVTQYNFPLIPIHLIQQFLKNAMQENEQDVDGFKHQIEISMLELKRKDYIHIFNKYFTDFTISGKEVAPRQYNMIITTTTSLAKLLHFTVVFCMFIAIINKIPLMLEVDMIKKYANSINIIEAPFFIRYLFVMYFLRDKKHFNEVVPSLTQGKNQTYHFAYGNTHTQRRNFIKEHLQFNQDFVDIGCGEGYYAMPFSDLIFPKQYYAIDIDEAVLTQLEKKIQRQEKKNILLYDTVEKFYQQYANQTVEVLLTEVIEHLQLDEAEQLILEIIAKLNFTTFIITTPNKAFNEFYILDELKRHDDHKWEYDQAEWENWMHHILKGQPVSYQFYGVGDSVNDIYTTQAVIIKKEMLANANEV